MTTKQSVFVTRRAAWLALLVGASCPAACKAQSTAAAAVLQGELRETRYDNGQKKEAFYVVKDKSGNYVKDGVYARFHQSGQKAEEGSYKADKLEGQWQQWDESGKRTLDIRYVGGKREGAYAKYVDGAPVISGNYTKDKLSGPVKFMGYDGTVVSGSMADGAPAGAWAITEASGKLRARAVFRAGKVEGAVESFGPEGNPRTRITDTACAEFEGYALGKTRWADVVFDVFARSGAFPESAGTSAYSQGPMLRLEGDLIATPGVSKITLIFDPDEVLTALSAVAKKEDGRDTYAGAFKRLHAEYSKKYSLTSASLPFVGDYHAEYRSGPCKIVLNAPHLSFTMEVGFQSEAFNKQMSAKASGG